jgi:hypothetical protein
MITSSPAKIIVSPIAIPDTSMGSWGKIIDYWLQDYVGNTVNYVLSPRSTVTFKSGRTQAIDCSYSSTEINHPLFLKWRFKKFFSGLQTVFAKHKLAVILVIENTKIKNAVADWLEKNVMEKKLFFTR